MSSIALFTAPPSRLIIKPAFMKLTERIRIAMKAADIKQADVARALGISPQAVNGWFRTNTVDKENVAKVAAMTGQPLDYFYGTAPLGMAANSGASQAARGMVPSAPADDADALIIKMFQDLTPAAKADVAKQIVAHYYVEAPPPPLPVGKQLKAFERHDQQQKHTNTTKGHGKGAGKTAK